MLLQTGSVAPLLNLIIGEIAKLVAEYDRGQTPERINEIYWLFVKNLLFLAGLALSTFIFGFLQTFAWSVAAERQTKVQPPLTLRLAYPIS